MLPRSLAVACCLFVSTPALARSPRQSVPAEQAVEVTSHGLTLYGTLLVPEGAAKRPVVLIIAGSGPTDRNGNSAVLPGHNDAYKMLASALAVGGIASLRYDKRAIGESKLGPGAKEDDLRFEDYVNDAEAWIAKLRQDARFSSVVVAGHSEGSLIGIIAGREAKADAVVSISGVAANAADVLRDQLRPQLEPVPALASASETILKGLEQGKTTADVPPQLAALYRPSVQPYLISWIHYVPSSEIAKVTTPVLILQGTTDIQVPVSAAQALKAAKPDATLDIVQGMNHVLKIVPEDRALQVASYSDPTLPIAPELTSAIVAFVKNLPH
jgi:hypothetical protein